MGRPKGMKKVNGIWYMPDGSIAPSSKNAATREASSAPVKAKGYQNTQKVINAPQKPVQEPTEALEDLPASASYGTGRLEVQEVPVGTVVGGRVQGMHLYATDEIKRIEDSTGLVFVGEFAEQQGALIPVFLRADHDEDTRRAKLAFIRRGY